MLRTPPKSRKRKPYNLRELEDAREYLPIGAASRLLGVSVSTLRRWEKRGMLGRVGIRVYYTPTHRRRFRRRELVEAMERSAYGSGEAHG